MTGAKSVVFTVNPQGWHEPRQLTLGGPGLALRRAVLPPPPLARSPVDERESKLKRPMDSHLLEVPNVDAQTKTTGVGTNASVLGALGGVLTSTAASICCIGPAGIALLGVNGAILAAGLKPYRIYLLSGSLVLIGVAFWFAYRRGASGARACPVSIGRVKKVLLWSSAALWVLAVAIQFAADRYWL